MTIYEFTVIPSEVEESKIKHLKISPLRFATIEIARNNNNGKIIIKNTIMIDNRLKKLYN